MELFDHFHNCSSAQCSVVLSERENVLQYLFPFLQNHKMENYFLTLMKYLMIILKVVFSIYIEIHLVCNITKLF